MRLCWCIGSKGTLHACCPCATGASQHALAAETTDQVAEALLDINTLAPIRLTQAILPYMLKR
jgi:short-subunit dehydrogenase